MKPQCQKRNSPEQINEIVNLYNSGVSSKKIAPMFGVSYTTIINYLREQNVYIRTNAEASRKYFLNENYFDVIDTAEKAQILGFLYADGYNHEQRHTVKIRLQKRDLKYLKKIKTCFQAENPIFHLTQKSGFKDKPGFGIKKYAAVEIQLVSKKMSQDLSRIGCVQAKSLILKFPSYEVLPFKFRWDFLRGYFEGDGCLTRTGKNWKFSFISTLEFLQESDKILQEANVHTYLSHLHGSSADKNTFVISCSGIRNVLRVMDKIYENPAFVMERKYQKYKDLVNQTIVTDNIRKNWAETSDKNQKLALELYKKGKTILEMAQIFGVAWQTAYGYLYENKEYNNNKTKSRVFNREQIYQRYLKKESLVKLSEEFNLNLRYLQEFLRDMFKKNNTKHLLKYGRITNIIGEYTKNGEYKNNS